MVIALVVVVSIASGLMMNVASSSSASSQSESNTSSITTIASYSCEITLGPGICGATTETFVYPQGTTNSTPLTSENNNTTTTTTTSSRIDTTANLTSATDTFNISSTTPINCCASHPISIIIISLIAVFVAVGIAVSLFLRRRSSI